MAKDSPQTEIARFNRAYCEAYNAGVLEKVLDFFSDDALTLSPDQEPVRGREALRRYYQNGFAREPNRDLELTSIRVEASGDTMYDAGRWTNSVTMADGTRQKSSGYYLAALRKIKGRWKVVANTFNVLQPIAPPPATGKK